MSECVGMDFAGAAESLMLWQIDNFTGKTKSEFCFSILAVVIGPKSLNA